MKQRGILHRFNVSFLKTLDLAFESAIDVAKWDEALEYGHELLPGFRLVMSNPNHVISFSNSLLKDIQTFLFPSPPFAQKI